MLSLAPFVTATGDRVALVAELGTPFARQLTALRDLDAIELGSRVTSELLALTCSHFKQFGFW